jgi:hypothetical protein
MIGLPNRVRTTRLAPVNQIECLAIGFGSLVRQGQQIGWQGADDVVDDFIGWGLFPETLCYTLHLAVQSRDR